MNPMPSFGSKSKCVVTPSQSVITKPTLVLLMIISGLCLLSCQSPEKNVPVPDSESLNNSSVTACSTSVGANNEGSTVTSSAQKINETQQSSGLNYLNWLIVHFDETADATDGLLLHISRQNDGAADWQLNLDEKFTKLMERSVSAKNINEPEGIFLQVHRFYIGGLREYEEAHSYFIKWKNDQRSGDSLDPIIINKIEQGRLLMDQVVVPAFHQAKARIEEPD